MDDNKVVPIGKNKEEDSFDDFLLNNLDSNMVQQGEKSRANSLRQSRLIPAVEYIQANRHRSNLISEFKLYKLFKFLYRQPFGCTCETFSFLRKGLII